MTKEMTLMAKSLIWEQLNFWCDQYKIANENKNRRFADALKSTGSWEKAEEAVKNDNEPERISKNIKALEQAYKAF